MVGCGVAYAMEQSATERTATHTIKMARTALLSRVGKHLRYRFASPTLPFPPNTR